MICLGAGLWLAPASGQAATCACANSASRSTQSGPSICSILEDGRSCAITAFAISAGSTRDEIALNLYNREALKRRLRDEGVDADPVAALLVAARIPPERWQDDDLITVLTVLFALPQQRDGRSRLAEIHAFLTRQAGEIRARFGNTRYRTEAATITTPEFVATISYGCLELAADSFLARARTPFSPATNRCGDVR